MLAASNVRSAAKTAQKNKKRAGKKTGGMQSATVQLPTQIGMTIQNNTSNAKLNIQRCELFGAFTVGPTTPANTVFSYPLNIAGPLFNNTVAQNFARSYQKFRFRSANLQFANTTGTNNGGSIVVGYCENPDQSIASVQDVFNLPGSKIFPLWMPTSMPAMFKDPRMYNIDADSDEVMQTTQGKFVIAIVAVPNTTGDVSYPLVFNYQLELDGSASQQFTKPSVTTLIAQSIGTGDSGGHGNFVTLNADSGYKFPALLGTNAGYSSSNPFWALSEPTEVATGPPGSTVAVIGSFFRVRAYNSDTQISVQFFETIEEARVSAVDTSSAIQNTTSGVVAAVLAQIVEQGN